MDEGWELSCDRWLPANRRFGFSDLEWLPARVPGHVHLDLAAHGILLDPFVALGELGCAWVDDRDWTYRKKFDFVPDPDLPSRVLRFEGLDTVAEIRLNGMPIGSHDNMFEPLELDVSSALLRGENQLEVTLRSATRVGDQRRASFLRNQGLSEEIVRFDDRAFVRKAQYMFGWDWGPRLVSAGIWGKVLLIEHRGRLLGVRVQQRHLEGRGVELRIGSAFEGAGEVVHFVEGRAAPIRDGEAVVLEKPELWWPAEHGSQRRYEVRTLLLNDLLNDRARAEAVALDALSTRIGLRRVRLVREPDAAGESFEIEVNGRRIWALGANFIPDHSFPGAIQPGQVRKQLLRARQLNMNMLRVWGGGLYESEEFYDACDELGLMVWQDFPYACSYYPDDEAACARARREAEINVERLRHHPSLVLWCGNNENLTMFEGKWGGAERHPPRYYGERIFEQVLPDVVDRLDGERPYVPTSPWGGQPCNSGGIGDQHFWDVWHGRGDWRHYEGSDARFASEFGFCSAPGPRAWRQILESTERPLEADLRDRRARWHDKTSKGYETFIDFVELHYPRSKTIEEWTYRSQLNQRDALRFGIEHYRRSAGCRGALIWQLNDCWPVQSWSVIDSKGDFKAAAFELRRLFAPILGSLVISEGRVVLWGMLDNATEPVEAAASIVAHRSVDGAVLSSVKGSIRLSPGERRPLLELDTHGLDPARTVLLGELAGTRTHRLLAEPKELVLADPELSVSQTRRGLSVAVAAPIVDLFLWDETGELELGENFVTLEVPGTIELPAVGEPGVLRARSLHGPHALGVSARREPG